MEFRVTLKSSKVADNRVSSLSVVLAVPGVFHTFELAHELDHRGYLKQIYSTFPWKRLKREGLSRDKVRMFPWIHPPQLVFGGHLPEGLNRDIGLAVARSFDWYIARTLPDCDVFVALSGCGVVSGRRAKQMGARFICDRGSSHIRYQAEILAEEYARWGIERAVIVDPRTIAREETEYQQADVITIPSEFARRSFIEKGIPAAKLRKIPYGVRLDRFSPSLPPASGTFEVLFAGQVALRKGIPYLLEAFSRLKHPRKRLRIVGTVQPEFKALAARFDLANVEILGSKPQAELARIMSSSHVLVLPSVEEGLALVQAQAMACGCPLISSTNTGGEDLFSDGVEGFLVPIRSPEAIAERLQQLADDPDLQQRMSEAGSSRVRRIGGWREYGERWMELRNREASSAAALQ